ncbi:MAG: 30S ribosomal protein S1 [Ruminococcaceae bacterium]|nr:30S ribosomal protein S1 [Oscillospiraceae bacterium]
MCTKCDEYHNLHVDLGCCKGIIPREEAAIGVGDAPAKEFAILSRVGKPVCFQVLGFDRQGTALLSRRSAQVEAKCFFLSALRPGDVIPAVVQNPAAFGVFCDIGCGVTALMRIDRCCVSRLSSTADQFRVGQSIYTAILGIDDDLEFIHLTGRELLGTWEENAELFRSGQTVKGYVRSVMPYGIFVELTPNLSGLAEPVPNVNVGDPVSVYIRSIQHDRHKIKLNILEVLQPQPMAAKLPYFITSGHMEAWEYYPGSSTVTYF